MKNAVAMLVEIQPRTRAQIEVSSTRRDSLFRPAFDLLACVLAFEVSDLRAMEVVSRTDAEQGSPHLMFTVYLA